jgi:hypothetical protein
MHDDVFSGGLVEYTRKVINSYLVRVVCCFMEVIDIAGCKWRFSCIPLGSEHVLQSWQVLLIHGGCRAHHLRNICDDQWLTRLYILHFLLFHSSLFLLFFNITYWSYNLRYFFLDLILELLFLLHIWTIIIFELILKWMIINHSKLWTLPRMAEWYMPGESLSLTSQSFFVYTTRHCSSKRSTKMQKANLSGSSGWAKQGYGNSGIGRKCAIFREKSEMYIE